MSGSFDRPRGAFALAALVVVAGCGVPALGGESREPTPPLTPAPVPEGSPERLAPGVTADGVDAITLKRAHVDRLAAVGFRTRRTRVVRYANGTLRSRMRFVATISGDGRYLIARTFGGPLHERVGTAGTVLQYGGRARTVRIRRNANGTAVDRTVEPPPADDVPRTALLPDPFGGRVILLALRAVDVGSVTPVDPSTYRIRGDGVDDPRALRSLLTPVLVESIRNVTLAAVVTDEGVIERFRLAYTVRLGDRPVRVVRTARFSLDGTRLRRPAWAANGTRTDPSRTTVNRTDAPDD